MPEPKPGCVQPVKGPIGEAATPASMKESDLVKESKKVTGYRWQTRPRL
jgi:hypothetical protein